MESFFKYWLPVLIWLGFIFVGSTGLMSAEQTSRIIRPLLRWLRPDISMETIAQVQFIVRKCAHVTEYAILAMLLWRALRRGTSLKPETPILFIVVWLVCAVFAASDEFHQSFVSSRTATLGDVLIDICGGFVGLAMCWAFATRRSKENLN